MTPIAKIEIAIPIPILLRNRDRDPDPDLNLKRHLRSNHDRSSVIGNLFAIFKSFHARIQSESLTANFDEKLFRNIIVTYYIPIYTYCFWKIANKIHFFIQSKLYSETIHGIELNYFQSCLKIARSQDRDHQKSRLRSPSDRFFKQRSSITLRLRKKIADRSCLGNERGLYFYIG